jgi:hypothetical protein
MAEDQKPGKRIGARIKRLTSNGENQCHACGSALRPSKIDREGYCSFCWRNQTEAGRQWVRKMKRNLYEKNKAKRLQPKPPSP